VKKASRFQTAARLVHHVHPTPLFKRSFGPRVISGFARRPQFQTVTEANLLTRLATRYASSQVFRLPFRFLAGGLLDMPLDRTGVAGWRRTGAKNACDLACRSGISN
jgi:hypothetical protein